MSNFPKWFSYVICKNYYYENKILCNSFFFAFLSCIIDSNAQVLSVDLTEKEKKYGKILIDLALYLKTNSTPQSKSLILGQTTDIIYTAITEKFFAKKRMDLEFSKDTDFFSVEDKIIIQKKLIHSSDMWLDKLPNDSLFIETVRNKNYFERLETDAYHNSLAVVFGKDKIFLLLVWFDSLSGKIISLGLGGMSEVEYKRMESYLKPTQ